eukprot:867171-Rhodomonas_salina.1
MTRNDAVGRQPPTKFLNPGLANWPVTWVDAVPQLGPSDHSLPACVATETVRMPVTRANDSGPLRALPVPFRLATQPLVYPLSGAHFPALSFSSGSSLSAPSSSSEVEWSVSRRR